MKKKKPKVSSLLLLFAMVLAAIALPVTAQAASKAPARPKISATREGEWINVYPTIISGAHGYQIRYATNSKFENAKSKTTPYPFYQFNAKPAKTYYIQARALSKSGSKRYYSKWSNIVKMTRSIPAGIYKFRDPRLRIEGGEETNFEVLYYKKTDKITCKSSNDCVRVYPYGNGKDYEANPNKMVYWQGFSCVGQKKGSSVISVYRNNKLIKKYTIKVPTLSKPYLRHLEWIKTVKKTWTAGMTPLEKLVAVGDYLMEHYSYNPLYSDSYGFSEGYGGDCWAATAAIMEFAKELGVPARAYDPYGASVTTGGHLLPIVTIDGVEYYIEAGYDGTAPRGKCSWGVFQP